MLHRQKVFILASLSLLVLTACGGGSEPASTPATPAPAAKVYDATKGSASISGTVRLDGAAPAMDRIKMSSDPVCDKLHASPIVFQEVVAGASGELQNVFVYVKDGLSGWKFNPPAEPVDIDQEGCMYSPHVMGIMAKQKFRITNSDATLHNIHSYSEKNKPFNIGQPVKGMTSEQSFDVPEVMVRVRCDVHKWMGAYVGVVSHPFHSVSGGDGAFSLKNLPAGQYVIEAWHEKYGTQTQNVTVADSEAKTLEFTFKAN